MGLNSKRCCKEYPEDRISALPDVVRCHILGFLPTRNAVKTCVLSSTWKTTWASVTSLNLSVDSAAGQHSAGFVDRVLFFRGGSTSIHKFHLQCSGTLCFSRIDLWINIATMHNVVEFHLDLSDLSRLGLYFELPRCIFVCKTLVVLKLSLGSRVITAVNPSSNWFPSLKYLHVSLDKPAMYGLMDNLFACCPVLEDLIIDGFLGPYEFKTGLHVSAPKLKRLKLCCWGYSVSNYEEEVYITANAPNLEYLDLKISMLMTFCLLKVLERG